MLRLCLKSQCKRVLRLVPRRKQTCLLKNMAMFGTPNWKLTAGLPKHHPLLKREIIWTESAWNEFHVNFPGYIHLGFPGCNQPEWNPTRLFLPCHCRSPPLHLKRNAVTVVTWLSLVGWLVGSFCYSHWCVTARCLEEPIPFLGGVTWVLYPQSTFNDHHQGASVP